MATRPTIRWTNKSVRLFAAESDPVTAMENAARLVVLKARDRGWSGPPFNPLEIAKMLGAKVEPNSSVTDACLLSTEDGPKIEFNPLQSRSRVRFSIAHEVAHLLFPDWNKQIRHRGKKETTEDAWQLEMLCNIAASEFVLPIGSLSSSSSVSPIEQLMHNRRKYDVSVEAFLLRLARISTDSIGVFFASPVTSSNGGRMYRVDYFVGSPTAPRVKLAGRKIPSKSLINRCIAIGHTDRANESWVSGAESTLECVGIPPYPGSVYPRVAALVRFTGSDDSRTPIRYVHGTIYAPRGGGLKILCQLVNDRAARWGGGVARQSASRFPRAEEEFAQSFRNTAKDHRLGQAIFVSGSDDVVIASLVAQEGYGPSSKPRIRYGALEKCFRAVAARAIADDASIHMPRVGMGAAGGDWNVISEMLKDAMVRVGLSVTIYDPPPKPLELELF